LTLHNDLIEQASYLAKREPKKPRQASLRRAVSTAYYALYHLLLHEATRAMFPSTPYGLREKASRAFSHSEAKNACSLFAKSNGGVDGLTTSPIEPALVDIAATFVQLQEARHDADYNLTEVFDRVQVIGYIDQVKDAFAKWKIVRGTANASVFLGALLLNSRWHKSPRP
jgi:hypothetical protein